jgi:hypothetical protein
MTEINANHKAVERGNLDPNPYRRIETDLISEEEQNESYYYPECENDYESSKELTQQEIAEDVAYLFEALYNAYPLYDYFGGKEVFDEAENAILQQCEEKESMTAEEF